MPESKLRIHPCAFDTRPCDNYTCRNALGKKKYFIGNPFGHGQKAIFCEDCIRDLVANIPVEFLEGGTDLETRLREEITAELEGKIRDEIQQELQQAAADQLRAQEDADAAAAAAAEEQQKQDDLAAAASAAADQAQEAEETKPVYRCLDCGEEFDTPQKLGSHKRKHKD